MSRKLSDRERAIKEELFNRFIDLSTTTGCLFEDGVDRVEVLKEMLNGKERQVAISLLPSLGIQELRELFDELVFLSSFSHGSIQKARDAILALPNDWVVSQIEAKAEKILEGGTDDEYRRLLELYSLVDQALTRRLANRAILHDDPDVREAGEDFLRKLDNEQNGTPRRNGSS